MRYFFSVFGTPSAKGTWGWRVEGHHVSLHFTVANGTLVASSPAMFGSNPAEVLDGPRKGTRILAAEEDTARELLMALDPSQRAQAVINAVAPNDMVTSNRLGITRSRRGRGSLGAHRAPARAADEDRGRLHRLHGRRHRGRRMARLKKAGLEKIAFAWAGEAERGKKHYYRIQGPTFLIEYDNTQNNGNHIHSVWRDFTGDFGRDLLREHIASVPH